MSGVSLRMGSLAADGYKSSGLAFAGLNRMANIAVPAS